MSCLFAESLAKQRSQVVAAFRDVHEKQQQVCTPTVDCSLTRRQGGTGYHGYQYDPIVGFSTHSARRDFSRDTRVSA